MGDLPAMRARPLIRRPPTEQKCGTTWYVSGRAEHLHPQWRVRRTPQHDVAEGRRHQELERRCGSLGEVLQPAEAEDHLVAFDLVLGRRFVAVGRLHPEERTQDRHLT